MTAEIFRKMALAFPQSTEGLHMNHPDFRVGGKIFATLGYPNKNWGMVKLTPEQQQVFVKKAPGVFIPCSGAWGRRGSTNVHLASAKKNILQPAMEAAVGNVMTQ